MILNANGNKKIKYGVDDKKIARVLLYRLGSIGDFIVSLPCLHFIRRRFADARICLLTNKMSDKRMAVASDVFTGSGLIDEYISYHVGVRNVFEIMKVRAQICSYAPDIIIYLTGARSGLTIYRDYLFFRACNIRSLIGFPLSAELRKCRPPELGALIWESEAQRLARCLSALGEIDVSSLESWDLRLTSDEVAGARRNIQANIGNNNRSIGLCLGTKQKIKDWGWQNWRKVLSEIGRPDINLVLVGAAEDRAASQEAARNWPGAVLNLCGQLSVRESAAVIKQLAALLCHDSGPMHLAAAVGTPCVAVFSMLAPVGMWSPFGNHHKTIYPTSSAPSIKSISPSQVIAAAAELLSS